MIAVNINEPSQESSRVVFNNLKKKYFLRGEQGAGFLFFHEKEKMVENNYVKEFNLLAPVGFSVRV